jgi:DnaA family protein
VELKLRADLLTRLGWGLVLQVRALNDEEKIHALTQRARARGFALPPEVCAYLLVHAPRDMESLFAALAALDRYSLETRRAITIRLLRELLAFDKNE